MGISPKEAGARPKHWRVSLLCRLRLSGLRLTQRELKETLVAWYADLAARQHNVSTRQPLNFGGALTDGQFYPYREERPPRA